MFFFFFSSRRRHTRLQGDWSSDVCSSDLGHAEDENSSIGERNEGSAVDLTGDLALTVRPESNVEIAGAGLRGFCSGQGDEQTDDEYRGFVESCAIHGLLLAIACGMIGPEWMRAINEVTLNRSESF